MLLSPESKIVDACADCVHSPHIKNNDANGRMIVLLIVLILVSSLTN